MAKKKQKDPFKKVSESFKKVGQKFKELGKKLKEIGNKIKCAFKKIGKLDKCFIWYVLYIIVCTIDGLIMLLFQMIGLGQVYKMIKKYLKLIDGIIHRIIKIHLFTFPPFDWINNLCFKC